MKNRNTKTQHNCSKCNRTLMRLDPVNYVITPDGRTLIDHKNCDDHIPEKEIRRDHSYIYKTPLGAPNVKTTR